MKKGNLKMRYLNKFKKLDNFGYPISLTYKNDPNFKSLFGAVVTMIVFLALTIYTLILIADLVQY